MLLGHVVVAPFASECIPIRDAFLLAVDPASSRNAAVCVLEIVLKLKQNFAPTMIILLLLFATKYLMSVIVMIATQAPARGPLLPRLPGPLLVLVGYFAMGLRWARNP